MHMLPSKYEYFLTKTNCSFPIVQGAIASKFAKQIVIIIICIDTKQHTKCVRQTALNL
jgi:hypothetical protein